VIRFEDVSIRYDADGPVVLTGVELHIPEGELCLVVGETGTGKSTLLQAINGLVPHFTGGVLSGRVTVAGRDTRDHPPRELADIVGMVLQDPMSGFVADVVEDELAYGMESLGVPPAVMRKRVEETLDLMGLADLRHRSLLSLSGGQRQRVAIGSVLTAHPRVLVLDEPTSALDPGAAEEVLAAVTRLVHDLGLTVVLAEHRLERVVQYADSVLLLRPGAAPQLGPPAEVMAYSPVAPPVVELGRLAGWQPLPLTIRDARRVAGDLRSELSTDPPPGRDPVDPPAAPSPTPGAGDPDPSGPPAFESTSLAVAYGQVWALREATLTVPQGQILALMGRNGAGKSTLLKAAVALVPIAAGAVRVAGRDPVGLAGAELVRTVGLVPQEPTDLLYSDTVEAECSAADRDSAAEAGTTAALLDRLAPEIAPETHPRDLSEGQRLCLVLAIVMSAAPGLLLLDEPTRGLDYGSKRRLVTILRDLAATGTAILLASHDVELVAEVADRVAIIADGEIVAVGPTAEVVTASPIFAPQVCKVLAPDQWLTVDQVAAALQVTR
jgi:energy-coupling factor transport system ATP-binding protein